VQTIHLVTALCLLSATADAADPVHRPPLGLTAYDGTLLLAGEPYRGIGANYFSLFSRTINDPTDTSYEVGLEALAQANIPFVRFMAGGFWPIDWDLYLQDKPEYFRRLDRVVHAAEQHRIGLIPSLFWNMATFPDIVGEPIDQLGNPESKTIAFIEQYTAEVVQRYRDSPAVWGWEFGNEYNLHADLPNASAHRPKIVPQLKTAHSRTARDELTSPAMLTAFAHFARAVRKHDTHRILITGNSIPRASAYHNTHAKSWQQDSRRQFEQILLRDNPSPFSVISVHIYRNSGQGNTQTIAELVTLLHTISARANQPLFIGEFGAPSTLGTDQEKARFIELLTAIESSQVPLAAFWVFDHPRQNADWNVTSTNDRSYMLQLIADANQRLKTTPQRTTNN